MRLPARRLSRIGHCDNHLAERDRRRRRNGNAGATTTTLIALLRITASRAANRTAPIKKAQAKLCPAEADQAADDADRGTGGERLDRGPSQPDGRIAASGNRGVLRRCHPENVAADVASRGRLCVQHHL